MYLKKISVLNFKNLEQCSLDFSSRINCFVGDNGAGKTNIVDAIYYMSMCKSAMGMTDLQNVRHGEDFFVLDGEYNSDSGKTESIVCGFKRGLGKTIKKSGKEYDKLSEHIGMIPIVIVSPSDSSLISDSADERRRYLNAFLSQTDKEYMSALLRYNQILIERNKLLKQPDSSLMDELLDILDIQMCEVGQIIHDKRKSILEKLAPLVANFYSTLSEDREKIELNYRSEFNDKSFGSVLQENRLKDKINQFSTTGPHRDDMTMKIGGNPLRKYGSQGQQKSFLIALKLGQYKILAEEKGETPLLLLDDLFDKLDNHRVSKLLSLVSSGFGQIFITDCYRDRLESILQHGDQDYSLWNIIDGEVVL